MRPSRLILCVTLIALVYVVATGCSTGDVLLDPSAARPAVQLDHPSQRALLGFVAGGLSAQERAVVAEHLRTCQRCDDYVASIETTGQGKKFRD